MLKATQTVSSRLLFRNFNVFTMTSRSLITQSAVNHDPTHQKFFIKLNSNEQAVLEYSLEGGIMDMYHTEVPPSYQGKGLAGLLAKAAFDHAVDHKHKMRLTCTYLQKYYKDNRNDEYEKLAII